MTTIFNVYKREGNNTDNERHNWLNFQQEKCMAASKRNYKSIGKHSKVLKKVYVERLWSSITGQFSNHITQRSKRYR